MPEYHAYSVAARQRVKVQDPVVHCTANGRTYIKGTCPISGKGVSVFIKQSDAADAPCPPKAKGKAKATKGKQKGEGLLDLLAPLAKKAAEAAAPVLGKAAAEAAAKAAFKKPAPKPKRPTGAAGPATASGEGMDGGLCGGSLSEQMARYAAATAPTKKSKGKGKLIIAHGEGLYGPGDLAAAPAQRAPAFRRPALAV